MSWRRGLVGILLLIVSGCGETGNEGRSPALGLGQVRAENSEGSSDPRSIPVAYSRAIRAITFVPGRQLVVAPTGLPNIVPGDDSFQRCLAVAVCRSLRDSAASVDVVLGIYQSTSPYVGDDAVGGKHPLSGKVVWAIVLRDTLIPSFGPGDDARGTAIVLVDAETGLPRQGFFTGSPPQPADIEPV